MGCGRSGEDDGVVDGAYLVIRVIRGPSADHPRRPRHPRRFRFSSDDCDVSLLPSSSTSSSRAARGLPRFPADAHRASGSGRTRGDRGGVGGVLPFRRRPAPPRRGSRRGRVWRVSRGLRCVDRDADVPHPRAAPSTTSSLRRRRPRLRRRDHMDRRRDRPLGAESMAVTDAGRVLAVGRLGSVSRAAGEARLESPSAAGRVVEVSTTRTSTSSPEGSGSPSSPVARRVARRVRATRRRPRRATGRRRVGARRRVGPHQLGRGGTDGSWFPGDVKAWLLRAGRARGRGEPSVSRCARRDRRERCRPARRDRRPRRRREPSGR